MLSEQMAQSTVWVDVSSSMGRLEHFTCRYVNSVDLRDPADRSAFTRAFQPAVVRGWLNVDAYYNMSDGTYHYEHLYGMLDRLQSLGTHIMLNVKLRTRPGFDDMFQAIESGSFSLDRFRDVLTAGLLHYKQRYPSLRYIEALNEYDLVESERNGLSVPYYEYYKAFYAAVNSVNERLQPDDTPLLLGGPVTWRLYGNDFRIYHWPNGSNLLEEFLDAYAADPNPRKRLDFLAYHEYLNRRGYQPSLVDNHRARIGEALRERGLDADVPILVTEIGVLPAMYGTDDYNADLLLQAAGVATVMYRFMEQGITTFHWVDHHPENDRKDILIPGHPGKFTPYGNMMRMQSLLKEERVRTTTDGQTPEGLGIYALGTADSSGVAVMLWNYDWPDYTWADGSSYTSTGRTHETTVHVVNLPRAFHKQQIRVEQYLIDSTHSHYGYNLSRAGLEKVRDTITADAVGFTTRITLERNAIALLVLSPVG